MSDTNEKYWAEYDGLQNAKHQLLKTYLGGWFPILSRWHGRVLYIDCHAGRGRHKTGQEGSPILALRLLLEHKLRTRILHSTEVHLYLFEIDQHNFDQLNTELSAFGELPPNIILHPFREDYAAHLQSAIDGLHASHAQMAPSFAFVDPYGFTISMGLLNQFIAFPTCELLVNFMYRYIDMAIHQPAQADNMDALFGSPDWRALPEIHDPEQRAEATLSLFSAQLRAKYVSHMYMRGENNSLKYVLIHATNHEKGRELMKEAIWSVVPDGALAARERDSPDQLVLIVPDPDLTPLTKALCDVFSGTQHRMADLYKWLFPQVYLPKHLHQTLRALRDTGIVEFSGFQGRFGFNKNPMVQFAVPNPKVR